MSFAQINRVSDGVTQATAAEGLATPTLSRAKLPIMHGFRNVLARSVLAVPSSLLRLSRFAPLARITSCAGMVGVAVAMLGSAAAMLLPTNASASVSVAVSFDSLVKESDAVVVVTAGDQKSVWEDGRIYTYTRMHVDEGVAGSLGAGADGWVRTMGGVVGEIGQTVDGEPVFVKDKPSLLFLRTFKDGGVFEVAARAQGQYPIRLNDATKKRILLRSTAVGMILPPKHQEPLGAASESKLAPQSSSVSVSELPKVRFARDVLHERPLEDVTREIASTWRRLHHPPATTK